MVSFQSKLPTATPNGRRSQFDNIARRVTKIERTTALVPIHFPFDRDSSFTQLLSPCIEVLGLGSERNVPSTGSAMGRNISARSASLARIKDQQDATAAA